MGGSYIDENGLAHRGDEPSIVSNTTSAQSNNDGSYIDENGLAHRGNGSVPSQSYYTDTLPGAPDTGGTDSNKLPLDFVSQQPTVQPYWEPDKIVERYDWYRANPDKEPEIVGPTKQETEAAYTYLANTKFKNVPRNDWEMTDYDTDPYYQSVISNWKDPREPQAKEAAATISQAEELMKPKEMQGTYQDLNTVGKAATLFIPTGTVTEGAPAISKFTQSIIPAIGSYMPGYLAAGGAAATTAAIIAATGGTAAIPIAAIANIGGIGTALLQAVNYITGKEIPILNKVGNWLDIIGQSAEKALVGMPSAIKAMHPEIDSNTEWGYKNPRLEARGFEKKPTLIGDAVDNLFDMSAEIIKLPFENSAIQKGELKKAWNVGAIGLEENPFIANTALNIANKILGNETADYGEYYRYELGTNEPQKAALQSDEMYLTLMKAVDVYSKMVNPETGKPYTGREIEDNILLRVATNQYGISGALNDIIGQELLDPTNYAGNIQNSVVNTYAKITGNQPLQTATEINAGESIAPFPINALSSKQKTGGLTELAEIHKKVLRGELGENAVKVDTLTESQRNKAGLTPEGKYRELQPAQPTQATGFIGKITNAIQNLTNLTPVAKAAELSKMALDMTSAVILMSDGNPETIRTNVLKLADMMEVSPDDAVSKIYGTAEQRTVTDALKAIATSPKFDGIVNQLKATESMRMNLSLLSSQIGKNPTEIIQGIIDNPQSIKRLIQEAAAKNNGSIMGQMLTDDGTLIIDQFQVFTDKKNPLPYTVEQVASEYNKLFANTLSDYVTELYDVKPDNVAIRISDMMKKFQSLLLLSLNPAYLANNFTNDIVTRAATGVFGFPNINDWVENEMGIAPARMYDSMQEFRGAENTVTGSYSIVNEKLKNAKRKGDKVDKISDLFSKVNSVMPGTKINGKIEGVESARANVVGQMQYMHKFWIAGKGFDELPVELKQRIDSVIPNGSWLLYSGIQSGYNFDKIIKNLFGEYVKPDLGSLLESIVQDKFPIDSEIVNELFAKTGKLSELQTLLDNTNTPEERAAVIESIRNRSKDIVKMYSDNQIISEAENVRNDIALSGDKNQYRQQAMKYISYVSVTREDQWLRSRESYRDAYAKKVHDSLTQGEWNSYIASIAARNRSEWNAFNAREKQVYAGIIRALGFSDEISAEYISLVMDYQSNWDDFYKYQQQKINEYYDGAITWEDYEADTDKAYDEHFQTEMLVQEKLNESFLRGYSASGFDVAPIRELQNRIITIRHEMHDMQVDIRQRTRAAAKSLAREDADKIKNEMYLAFEPEYNGKIEEIYNLQSQIGAEVGRDPVEKAREQIGRPIESVSTSQTPADNLDNAVQKMKAQVILNDADVIRSNAQTDYDNAIHETEADRQAKAERPEYYTRDKIRQSFIDSGFAEDAVDLYMELFDAREKQWNKQFPGKDMYKEALRVINITKDEMQGDPLLSQVEVLSPADINTDKFRNWFGDSKVVDADGKPLVVYHGSPYNFDVFSYDKMGTNGTSEGYGFYFSDSKDIAEGYSRGQGNKYESYVKITKPLSNDGKSLTKNDLRKLIINIDKMDIEGEESAHWFLSDFNDVNRYGINKVVNEAVNLLYENNSNDVDLISEMINVSGSAEKVYRALKNTLGYDGIITKWEANDVRGEVNIYIPFLPEQIKSINNTGSWDPNNPNMLYQTYSDAVNTASPWYSYLETVVTEKFPERMKVESVRNWLIKQGISSEELRWSGVDDFLADATGQVTKADLQSVIDSNQLRIEEVTLQTPNLMSNPEYKKLSDQKVKLEGELKKQTEELLRIDKELNFDIQNKYLALDYKKLRDNPIAIYDKDIIEYVELIDKKDPYILDNINNLQDNIIEINTSMYKLRNQIYDGYDNIPKYSVYTTKGDYTNYTELIITLPNNEQSYQSYHWIDTENPIFHVRFNDRIDTQGRRILYIEEFQSDWIQDIQKGKNVPDAPFKDTWESKAIQRLMNYAAQNDYDMVAWTPGSIQFERWGLGGVADTIEYKRNPYFDSFLIAQKGNNVVFSDFVTEKKLPDYIGKEKADLILNSQEFKDTGIYTLSGEEITVGYTWPLKVYDQDITNATKKIVKKYGSDLETITIDAGEKGMLDVSAYKVTPDMKEPQRLFQNTLNERIKGTFHVVDGDTAIHFLESKDVTTLVHESGHLFRRTLNDKQLDDFAQWAGFKSADEYLDYDNRFWDGKLTEEESKRYSEAEEKFARGWEQYLIEGKAPTPTLTKVFKAFTEWMLDIYKAVKSALTSKDYSGQKEFIFNGKPLDIKAEINGVRLVDIFDSMLATKETRGSTTTANGIIDPTMRYEFQYKIMDLSDIKPSHQWSGDKLIDNSMYDKALQPRAREQQQSVMQINNMASELSPDLLLLEYHSLDRGAPIIGDDNNIESGNGRMLALLRAKERYPERWAEYQQALLSEINNYGINPEALSEFRNPVLVRERITDIDRTDFAREANKPVALQMTAQENAVNDSKLISDVALSNLDILDNETIEGAIDARRNSGFVQSFMSRLSDNEAAQYYFKNKDGNLVLNEQGRRRIVNALFAKVYGQAGDSLLQSFTMSTESNIKLLEAALKDSLPQMAVIEGMIARGIRSPEYSIANDIAIAGEKLTRLRRTGMNVSDYLNQISLPGLEEELTPAQRMFLQYFSEQRSAKKMRQFIREYANLIRNMPDSGQDALFYLPPVSKEELITRAFEKIGDDKSPMLFQTDWLASAIAQFDAGNPITLEQLKQIATPDYQNTELTPDENIIPDIDEYTTDEIYAKKINPIMHGEYMIAARVYKDGFPIAYYPYNLRMKEIPYNGKAYDVLGIDIDNADQYLFWDGEQIITIDTKQDLADLDIMDDMPTIPQGKQESFLTMPAGEAYEELVSKYLDPILDELHDRYEAELTRNKMAGSFSQLDNDSKVALYKYMNGVKDSLAATKYNALKFGEMKRDQALLNYNKRYGFDTYLTVISPYQFWYTRSMLNWAKRMIDKPVWFTTYARLKEKEELFARDENPTRLSGTTKFPMPYLEDWMGGALYIDTMSQFFPFAQFLNKAESYSQDKNFLNKKVESLLKEQLDEGMIKSQDYLEALRTKNTPAWNDAYAIISENYSKDPSLGGLAQQYMQLPFLLTWAINKAKGKEGEIGNLPITRTGLSLQTLTKGIPVLETAGNIVGGAMTLPEQGLRKLFNLDYNELGNYGDYSIRKQLSQMGNSGEISREEMLDAQRTFSGPAYEEAYRRQREELMLKTQGAAAIDAMKAFIQGDAKITDVLQALFVAPFGGSVYPEDEYQLRQKQDELEQAYDDQASGKRPKAVSEFFDANPTFIGRKASFIDDPEELNKYIAYQNITNAYYNLPKAQQLAVQQSLGTDFYNAVINKETRNYKSTSYDDLLTWEYAMRGDIPNLPASEINKAKQNAPKITYYTQPVVDAVDTFNNMVKQNFPANIGELEKYYYSLPKQDQYDYLRLHPELDQYIQFKYQYKQNNEAYQVYKEDQSNFLNNVMAQRCFSEMAESVRNDLEYSKVTGKQLRGASINQLKYLYQKYDNFNSFDKFVEILKVYE